MSSKVNLSQLTASSSSTNLVAADEPRKKRAKKEVPITFATKVPLPSQRECEKLDRNAAIKDAHHKHKLSAESLPSALLYTILNAKECQNSAAICATIAEDSSMIAVGFSDSVIRVWPLSPNNLTQLRPAHELEDLDKEADDILTRMFDDKHTFEKKVLCGHSGPVFGVSIGPGRELLLSCSEDGTIRLWSLKTWTNICVYKSHCYPVWSVKFCPHGYYFASCSYDRTARLWATEHLQPLRIFVGHLNDVDCVEFHPSSNYIASGSTDTTIKIWDLIEAHCVKTLEGHSGRITSMTFSIDGKFLVSGAKDKKIIIWEHTVGHKLAELEYHSDTITTMSFSRCGAILVTGGSDDCVNIWDFNKFLGEVNIDELNSYSTPNVHQDSKALLLSSYRTKRTLLLTLHFTRRNLMLAAGVFHSYKYKL